MQMHVRHWPIIREASAGLRRDERKTGTIRLPVDDTSYFNRARDLRRGGRRGAVGDGENKTISGKMVGGRKEKKREGEREREVCIVMSRVRKDKQSVAVRASAHCIHVRDLDDASSPRPGATRKSVIRPAL